MPSSDYRDSLAAYSRRIRGADRVVLPNNISTIRRFQSFHNLTPDGIVGPRTRAVMQRTNTTLDR